MFLGSEDYPYKARGSKPSEKVQRWLVLSRVSCRLAQGVLDMAANRLFARGTNAWTAVDSTVYTTSHAGGDGLLAVRSRF